MPKTTAKPQNAPWLTPYLMVRDVEKAAQFYQLAFRFKIRDLPNGPDGTPWHGELTYNDQLLMMGKENAEGSVAKTPASTGKESPVSLYVYTDNVDEFYQHALAHQAVGVSEPADMFWGDRTCTVKDLDGYNWCFATHIGEEK